MILRVDIVGTGGKVLLGELLDLLPHEGLELRHFEDKRASLVDERDPLGYKALNLLFLVPKLNTPAHRFFFCEEE